MTSCSSILVLKRKRQDFILTILQIASEDLVKGQNALCLFDGTVIGCKRGRSLSRERHSSVDNFYLAQLKTARKANGGWSEKIIF